MERLYTVHELSILWHVMKWLILKIECNIYKYYILILAVYNWPGDIRHGLPLEIGDTVEVLEEYSGEMKSICLIFHMHTPHLYSIWKLIHVFKDRTMIIDRWIRLSVIYSNWLNVRVLEIDKVCFHVFQVGTGVDYEVAKSHHGEYFRRVWCERVPAPVPLLQRPSPSSPRLQQCWGIGGGFGGSYTWSVGFLYVYDSTFRMYNAGCSLHSPCVYSGIDGREPEEIINWI